MSRPNLCRDHLRHEKDSFSIDEYGVYWLEKVYGDDLVAHYVIDFRESEEVMQEQLDAFVKCQRKWGGIEQMDKLKAILNGN